MTGRGEKPPAAAFITLGCKANRYDTQAMMAMVSGSRYLVIEAGAKAADLPEADVYIINTCTVTGQSDFQSRQMVRRVKRRQPNAKVIVTGCLAAIDPQAALAAGADLVAGPGEREKVIGALAGKLPPPSPVFHHPEGGAQPRGRAVIKIQDGCNSRCAYCIVSTARGPSRSVPPDEVIDELRALASRGFAEAVVTGIHLGLYGHDLGSSLLELLRRVSREPGMPRRLRLSSIEPQELTEPLIDFIADSGIICPHLHLPLQSGDETVLRAMRRPYSPADFERLFRRVKERIPHAAIGADIICGFPGETEENHRATVHFVENLPLSYFHVFPFSARPGTEAAGMPDRLPPAIIKERARELRETGAAKKRGFLRERIGETLEVLVENADDQAARGTSGNYARVEFSPPAPVGSLVRVAGERATPARVIGRAVKE